MSKRTLRIGFVFLTLLVGAALFPFCVGTGPRPYRPWNERIELTKFEAEFLASGKPTMRIIVQLDGVVGAPGSRPTAAKNGQEQKDRNQAIAQAQNQFLNAVGTTPVRSARKYPTIPFLAMEVGAAEVAAISNLIRTVPVTTNGARTFRIRVEADRAIRPQFRASTTQASSMPSVLTRIGWPTVTRYGTGPIIAVIDERISANPPLLQARIEDRKAYALGYPNAASVEPAYDPTVVMNHATGVACVIAASDAWPNILGLRCDEATGEIWSSNVTAALVDIKTTWVPRFGDRLKVVSMSLGDEACFSDTECECWPTTTAAMTAALVDLDALGVTVVLPAGNKGAMIPGVVFPACFANAVTVGATYADSAAAAGISCWSSQVDLCAPGHGVVVDYGGTSTITLTGTSIAVPFVASAFAVLRATHTSTGPAGILDALRTQGVGVTPGASLRNPTPATVPEIRVAAAELSLGG